MYVYSQTRWLADSKQLVYAIDSVVAPLGNLLHKHGRKTLFTGHQQAP